MFKGLDTVFLIIAIIFLLSAMFRVAVAPAQTAIDLGLFTPQQLSDIHQ